MTGQMIVQEKVEMILDRNTSNIVNFVIRMAILGKTAGREANVRKRKRLREIDKRMMVL